MLTTKPGLAGEQVRELKTVVLPPFTGEVFEQTFRDAAFHPLIQHVVEKVAAANVDNLFFQRVSVQWDSHTVFIRCLLRPQGAYTGMRSVADPRPTLICKLDTPRTQWLDYAIHDAENCIRELIVSTGVPFPTNQCAVSLKRPVATTTWVKAPGTDQQVSYPLGPIREATSTFSLEELDAED